MEQGIVLFFSRSGCSIIVYFFDIYNSISNIMSGFSGKVVELTVGGGVSNYHAFRDSCMDAIDDLVDTEFAGWLRELLTENDRPAPQHHPEETFAAWELENEVAVPMPQRTDPTAPGFIDTSTFGLTTYIERRHSELNSHKLRMRADDRERVRKQSVKYNEWNNKGFGWIKSRVKPAWADLNGAPGFSDAITKRDGAGLWIAIHSKYQFGTDGTSSLTADAQRAMDLALLSFSMGSNETLGDYWVRFDTAIRRAKDCKRPEHSVEQLRAIYLAGLAPSKYAKFVAHVRTRESDRALQAEPGQELPVESLELLRKQAHEFMVINRVDDVSRRHLVMVAEREDDAAFVAEIVARTRELRGDHVRQQPVAADTTVFLAPKGAAVEHDMQPGKPRKGKGCTNCREHGDYSPDHLHFECKKYAHTEQTLKKIALFNEKQKKALKDEDSARLQELERAEAEVRRIRAQIQRDHDAAIGPHMPNSFKGGKYNKGSKYLSVCALPAPTLSTLSEPCSVMGLEHSSEPDFYVPDFCVCANHRHHCFAATGAPPGLAHPFDNDHAIFDNQAGVSMVRDASLLQNLRPIHRPIVIGGINAGSAPLRATHGGELGDFGFVLHVPDATCQVIAQATCEQRRYPVYMTGGVHGPHDGFGATVRDHVGLGRPLRLQHQAVGFGGAFPPIFVTSL